MARGRYNATRQEGDGERRGRRMPAAHIEFYGGPLDGTRLISTTEKLPDVWEVDGEHHRYKLRCVLKNVPAKVPHGRFAMDYVGVVDPSPKNEDAA